MPESLPKYLTRQETIAILEAALHSLQGLNHTEACPQCGRPLTVPWPGAHVVNLDSLCRYCQPVAPITPVSTLNAER